jgi:hypothetical protein
VYKVIGFFVFICSWFVCANDNYQGYWTRGCDNSGYGSIYIENVSDINVAVNAQLLVKAKSTIKNNKMSLKLVEPLDNAVVGNTIQWSKLSLDEPIAIIVFENEKRAQLYWFGFFDKSIKKYVWANESDLTRDYPSNKGVPLVKCEY